MIAVKQVEIPKTDADRGDSRQSSVVEALKMESETLKDLDHPNIVQYLGFEQTPDFLSMCVFVFFGVLLVNTQYRRLASWSTFLVVRLQAACASMANSKTRYLGPLQRKFWKGLSIYMVTVSFIEYVQLALYTQCTFLI